MSPPETEEPRRRCNSNEANRCKETSPKETLNRAQFTGPGRGGAIVIFTKGSVPGVQPLFAGLAFFGWRVVV